jgi:type IV pilus assembly protein PilV
MLTVHRRLDARHQQGMFLIEALLGILIFSMGILALVGMQAAAISAQSDARYRTEAATLADRLMSHIWVNVDRTSAATIQTSLANFQHQTGGANCTFTGTASSSALVTDWVSDVTAAGTGLPGASSAMQQITINTAAGGFNQVSITLCWIAPRAVTTSRHTVVSFIN